MNFLIHTDLGHDPDDAVAISYLIEHKCYPTSICVTPGYGQQEDILSGLLTMYGNTIWPSCYYPKPIKREKEKAYNPAKHSILIEANRFCQVYSPYDGPLLFDKALILGPAVGLGKRLHCDEMFFQGGYSPNTKPPLEKFAGMEAMQSYNPTGSKIDFNLLLESPNIKKKYYIGKNVCHGFTKQDLIKIWTPSNSSFQKFFKQLDDNKAMHDVLAAMMFLDKSLGIWEQAKPKWVGHKLTTEPTTEEIYTLIGIK
jgi:hypothetical protein